MQVAITEWALDSYLELKHKDAFSKEQFEKLIKPDVELLKEPHYLDLPKFRNSHFWGPAQDMSGSIIPHGFKMKWRNLGNGRNQIRLTICILDGKAYLCHAYVKSTDSQDKRFSARLKNRIADIQHGFFVIRGYL